MSRPRIAAASVIALATLLVAAPEVSADKLVLRHVYKAGEQYLAVVSQTSEIAQTPPGGAPVAIRQELRMDMRMDVLTVTPDGTAEVKVVYGRVVLRQESPYGKTDYDSADPEKGRSGDPTLVGFRALIGQSLTMTVTPRGEVKGVRGIDKIREAVLEQVPEGAQREAARKQLGQTMNEEHFSQQMSGLGILFPEEPVGAGDAWRREQKTNLGFVNLVVTSNYKMERIEGDTIEISVDGTLVSGGEDERAPTPMRVTVHDGSRQHGTIRLSRASPTVSTTDMSQNMIMTVSVGAQSVRQTVNGITSVTIRRAN